jgi:hypothetical protein
LSSLPLFHHGGRFKPFEVKSRWERRLELVD